MTAIVTGGEASHPRLCPACDGTFRVSRHAWLYECDTCGLLGSTLTAEIPETASSSKVDEERRLRGLAGPRLISNSIIIDLLRKQFGGKSKAILDVGCGHGLFMTEAIGNGFACQGIEPDANVFAIVAAKGLPVRQGFFPGILSTDEIFDAIVFNDVFEHIPDVTSAIRACRQHLAPNGILVVNCPDRSGIFYKLADLLDRLGLHGPFDRLWQRGLPSPHLWYFTPEDLLRLTTKYGFESKQTVHLAPVGLKGLKQRIFHIEDQSRVMSWCAFIVTLLALPFLKFLPKDIAINVYIKKQAP